MLQNVTSFASRAGVVLLKHLPKILVGAGVVGYGASVVMASNAATKAEDILLDHERRILNVEEALELDDSYTEKDAKKDRTLIVVQTGKQLAKVYTPTALVFVASTGLTLGGFNILSKRHTALTVAYTGVLKAFGDYRARVVKDYGSDVDYMIRNGLQKVEATVVGEDGKKRKGTVITKAESITPFDGRIYRDVFTESNPYAFPNVDDSLSFLKGREREANNVLKSRIRIVRKRDPETGKMVERKIGHYFLNEARDKIGLPHKGDGFAMIGWVYDEAPDHIGDNHVSFGIDQIIQTPEFLHGPMRDIPLDFNVDGVITDLI